MNLLFLGLILISALLVKCHLPVCDDQILSLFSNSSRLVFKEYKPLMAESAWVIESHKYKTYTGGLCQEMEKQAELLADINRASMTLMAKEQDISNNFKLDHLYSQMIYEVQNTNMPHLSLSVTVAEYIEPMIGILRDPFSIPCGMHLGRVYHQARDMMTTESQFKRNLLLQPHAPKIIAINSKQKCITTQSLPFDPWKTGNVYIFDLGATFFGTWGKHDVSASAGGWFYYNLGVAKVPITHYWAFEADVKQPSEIWKTIPPDLLARYTYINIPVSADPKHRNYPWNFLEQIARPEDYVIIKVDIDTPDIENPIVDHLLTNPKYLKLIDEFFYEHHVDVEPMHQWWGSGQNIYLADSYRIFTEFRKSGVRSHYWP